jgi:hypothetical protein
MMSDKFYCPTAQQKVNRDYCKNECEKRTNQCKGGGYT